MAAPFGTEEDLLLRFGVQGPEWIPDANGNPQLTEKGQADFMPWRNLVAPAPVAFVPGNAPEFPQLLQDWERQLAAGRHRGCQRRAGLADVCVQRGATANRVLGDGLTDIVTGRRALSEYDGLVREWLSAVGTTAKKEYEDAYAAAQSTT